jgi:hypothetical protein
MKKPNEKKAVTPEIQKHRKNFKAQLLQNPNFFGTGTAEKGAQLPKAVFALSGNTSFEELTCVGYNHHTRMLAATFHLKQNNGYSGDYCHGGSVEYVRFFVDWQDNGSWTDEGLASVAVHDPGFPEDLCYTVEIRLDSRRRSCCDKKPVLPKVRAILSWNQVPTMGDENFNPVWGNRLETHIQIAPRTGLLCLLDDIFIDKGFQLDELDLVKIEPLIPVGPPVPPVPPVETSFFELKKTYGKVVEENRFGYPAAAQLLAFQPEFSLLPQTGLDLGLNLKGLLEFIQTANFNTGYEELTCVGLDRDRRRLHATVRVKREQGYSGGLCTAGSKEYVAFYMDFGAGFQYIDTASLDVHDVPGAKVGLTYDISVPVNLDEHRLAWCKMGKAKVRAILSWNTVPPIDPNYVAPWGDWEECFVEIKPLPRGVHPGNVHPSLSTVGGMDTDDINQLSGLATSTSAASLGGAFRCAFDGEIRFSGKILNLGGGSMKYRLIITEPESAPRIMLDTQTVRYYGDLFNTDLIPDANGWMPYNDDVQDDLLGRFYPGKHGMHEIRLEITDGTAAIFPYDETRFLVDKAGADVDIVITNGTGDCGDFVAGNPIEGTYKFTDEHAWNLGISLTPATVYSVEIDGVPVSGLNYQFGTLPATGKTGTWRVLTTAGLTRPCGYNVWIGATERVIVNSVQVGRYYNVPKGFCLD